MRIRNTEIDGTRIEVGTIFGVKTQAAIIELLVGETHVQMDVAKAREVTAMLVEATEAAISDELIVKFFMKRMNLNMEKAAMVLQDFRELRQGSKNTVYPS